MREYLRDYLVCPACYGELSWDMARNTFRLGEDTGLALSIENPITAWALPTSVSEITGIGTDALPLREMALKWYTVVLRPYLGRQKE